MVDSSVFCPVCVYNYETCVQVSISCNTCNKLITVNQQILAAIKFGVSQNKVIWRLLNLASPRLCKCMIDVTYAYVPHCRLAIPSASV